MKLPLQVVFPDMPAPAWVQDLVRKRVDKLEQYSTELMSCHVAIRTEGEHHHQGHVYQVRVDLRFRGEEIFAGDHHGNEDVAISVRDAFDAVERKLSAQVKRRREQARRPRSATDSMSNAAPGSGEIGDGEPLSS